MSETRGPGPAAEELQALQAAEEVKADPSLDEVEPAAIEVSDGSPEREEPFEKLATQARRISPERARTLVEALLFLAERPLPVEAIRQATGLDVARIRKALDELAGHFREGVSGIVLHEVANGWQLRTSPDTSEFARRFLRMKPQRLTRAALETLAIVAYRQPATRPEVEEIRGVDSGAVMKALLERKLLKILGKKEEPGRPILYGTTREFLEFFALKDLASMPTLREFHELSEEHREIVEKEAPAEVPNLEGLVAELADPNLRAAL
jgi:segregation and condensation protein B